MDVDGYISIPASYTQRLKSAAATVNCNHSADKSLFLDKGLFYNEMSWLGMVALHEIPALQDHRKSAWHIPTAARHDQSATAWLLPWSSGTPWLNISLGKLSMVKSIKV